MKQNKHGRNIFPLKKAEVKWLNQGHESSSSKQELSEFKPGLSDTKFRGSSTITVAFVVSSSMP